MQAKDLMTKNPRTCGPNDTLREAISIMKEEDVGIVPITEGDGDKRVVGVVTDRDAALRLAELDQRPSEVAVSRVMSTGIVTAQPDDDIDDVARKMEDRQVRRILVSEGGRLLGVISTADLARAAKTKLTGKVIERISEPGRAEPRA
jgi:CBS domain-containing protein